MYINLITIDLCPGQGGGGVKPSGSLEISENGVYDVYSYASASVDVHPSASLSETYTTNGTKTITGEFNGGSITINVHPSTSLSETYISNGNYNITGEFNGGVITVDVPAPQFVTETLNVSSNGTYNPGQGIDGYSQVVVDVPQSVTGFTEKEITEGVQIVNLSNSASFVGDYAFIYNNHLTTVNLPMCSSVGSFAFSACNSLRSISLPVCTYVGGYTFQYCNNLSSVNFLPMCSSVGSFAFTGCSSLRTVDLPVCTYVGGYTFQNCDKLSSVNLPICSVVNTWTFYRCISLSIIDLPMCSKIDEYAFYYCLSLKKITVGTGIDTVCVLVNTNAFDGCSALTSIYVPASLVDSYKSAKNWSYFSNRIFPIE